MNLGVLVFIYQRVNYFSSVRLDFFLIFENLQLNFFLGIYCIELGIIKSGIGVVDYFIIILFLIEIGEGLWEFDNFFLLNEKFVELIKYVVLLNKVDVFIEDYQEYFENFFQKIKLKCILYFVNKNYLKIFYE